MKFPNISQVILVTVLSATTVLVTAIVIDFTGAIDMSCGSEGCRIRLESKVHPL